ncbi:MAG: ribosome biogenesis GTP-binding protein YihA/YsxC [Defluviitaleaceae bacterium]|nr:ribosome biogenesis GTP-binding protein YihA/YsxC [Defluviitaleaceae bacterium]
MIINKAELTHVAVKPEGFPTDGLAEAAFVGKSNVGKSSLINCMLGRRALARTSQTPGKTRTINFYGVEDSLVFVDLPGYGYAKISKEISAGWGAMIEGYLRKRGELKVIVMLVDIRHEPGANDVQMFDWLRHYNHTMVVTATKADKISRGQVAKHCSVIRKGLGMAADDVLLPFSSQTKAGRDELWAKLFELTGAVFPSKDKDVGK